MQDSSLGVPANKPGGTLLCNGFLLFLTFQLNYHLGSGGEQGIRFFPHRYCKYEYVLFIYCPEDDMKVRLKHWTQCTAVYILFLIPDSFSSTLKLT